MGKSKALTGWEPRKKNNVCSSHFLSSETYVPKNLELGKPSDAEAHTFYMYRVQGPGAVYPLGDVNTGTLSGILWYLHNECIHTCTGKGWRTTGKWGEGKFNID